jgi:hypothetical protein
MRTSALLIAALALGCSSKSGTGNATGTGTGNATGSGSGSASGTGTGTGTGSGTGSAPASPHPLPKKGLDALRPYGDPHSTPIYIPAKPKDVEHWLAFVGGDSALSAWLVTPSDDKHLISQIGEWPTGLRVRDAFVEAGNHGFAGNDTSSNAYLLVESLPGLGQPAGLRAIVRVDISEAQYVSSVSRDEALIAPSAGLADTAKVKPVLDAVSAEEDAVIKLLSDEQSEQLAALLGKKDVAAADLAALVPKAGLGVATQWQKVFVNPVGKAATADDLRALIAGRSWECHYATCDAADELAVLGAEDGHLVIREILRSPPPLGVPTAGARKVIAASPTTEATAKAVRALGTLDAKVVAEAPFGAHGTIGVAGSGSDRMLIVRDGGYVMKGSGHADEDTPPDQLRFLDVDGDGYTDVASTTKTEEGEQVFFFDTPLSAEGGDVAAGMAAIGAKDLDDAVARALALTDKPVTPAAACALLAPIKNARTLKKAGPHARVYAFTEPGEPEIGHADVGKSSGKELHADLGSCDLACDPVRPVCSMGEMPGVDYFLFTWNGDKLELLVAAVYRGA